MLGNTCTYTYSRGQKVKFHFHTTENFIVSFHFRFISVLPKQTLFSFCVVTVVRTNSKLIDGSPMNNVLGLHTITIAGLFALKLQ